MRRELSESERRDLERLAIDRVGDAVASVAQLLGSDQAVAKLMIAVAVSTTMAAAELVHTGMQRDGKKSDFESALAFVTLQILKGARRPKPAKAKPERKTDAAT